MSGVVLPPSQRRLRHVEAICFRNLRPASADTTTRTRRRGATTTSRMRRQTVVAHEAPPVAPESIGRTRYEILSSQGDVLHRSEVHGPSKHPTFAPINESARRHPAPQLQIRVYAVDNEQETLIQSCTLDLRQLTFEARSLTALGRIRSQSSDVAVFIKCDDGVFRSGSAISACQSSGVKDAQRDVNSISEKPAGAAAAAVAAAADGDDDPDAWDYVDVDMVRDEERRLSKAPETRTCVLLSMCAATVAASQSIAAADAALGHARSCLRSRHNPEDAKKVAANALRCASAAVRAAKLAQLKRLVAQRRQENDARRERIHAAAERLAADEATVQETAVSTPFASSLEYRTLLSRAKQRLVMHIGDLLQVQPSDGGVTVLGNAIADDGSRDDAPTGLGHLCIAIAGIARISGTRPVFPVKILGARSVVASGWEDDAPQIALHGTTKAERATIAEGVRLLQVNVVTLAFALHGQRQAEGLPLGVALQKLLANS